MVNQLSTGTLYVVATPIGNLADMTARAVAVLQSAELIAAEDTRHSGHLLSHFDVRTSCIPYHEHSEEKTTQKVINVLRDGGDVALISDAGTPLISDPGFRLLQRVRSEGLTVSPIPGPSAVIAALSVAGLPTDGFHFGGFLPAKQVGRKKRLETLRDFQHTMVFYEAPHRIVVCLQDMCEIFGGHRQAVLARELTKMHETVVGMPLSALLEFVQNDSNQRRGEIVVLVAGAEQVNNDDSAYATLRVLLGELPVKQAAAIAAKLTGVKKNALYAQALRWQEDQN